MPEFATYPKKWGSLNGRETLDTIKSVGFTAICLNSDVLGEESRITIEDYHCSGLHFENIHLASRGTSDMWRDGLKGDAVCETYIAQFQKCRDFGIRVGVAHVTWGLSEVPPPSVLGLDRFKRLVEAAEKNDLVIAFENSVYSGHLRYVLDNIQSPSAMFCFDSGHRNAFCPEEKFFPDYSDRLVTMHLQDNDGARDLHVCPLDGCIDWQTVIGEIKDTEAFKRCLTFEVGGGKPNKFPGQSEKDLRRSISHMPVAKEEHLYTTGHGFIEFYTNLTYEEYLIRQITAAKKLAGMAE